MATATSKQTTAKPQADKTKEAILEVLNLQISVNGHTAKLESLLSEDDFFVRNGGRGRTTVIIKHEPLMRLAKFFGLRVVKSQVIVQPTISNNQLVAFELWVGTGEEDAMPYVGEASNLNTRGISAEYKVTMAFKRAFDKAVIDWLGLGSKNVYSEAEADAFDETNLLAQLTNDDHKALAPYLNKVSEAKTFEEYQTILKEARENGLTELQMAYLKQVIRERVEEIL